MNHPWKEIPLGDYENHMSLDSVGQLRALNRIMKDQFEAPPIRTAMVLGAAGGNGLEHIRKEKYDTVWAVDINEAYLKAAAERHAGLRDILRFLCLDLAKDADQLPQAELVIADLLVEYIGYDAFRQVLRRVNPEWVSCAIQINTDEAEWVSDSPYLHAFDRLDEVHHQMEENALTGVLEAIGYAEILREDTPLPNGKKLVRLDYRKTH